MAWKGLIKEYQQYLPVSDQTEIITLFEGNTPLYKLKHIPKKFNIKATWYIKYEGLNPTGSFKDRGMTMAITKAHEEGSKIVMCASTGNTSASAAAYAAQAGMKCIVLIPDGKIALGKLSQAMLHGAMVLQIKGNFDDALTMVRNITKNYPISLVNSVNPYRIEGQKTASFEIVDELGDAPDYHFIPVGNAGNITAYWKGYNEYKQANKSTKLPKMMGFQAAGAAPLVLGEPIKNPETIATAIRIGNPASWDGAINARDLSGGIIDKVSDDEITEAQKLVASHEGIFFEPACGASIAGVLKRNQTDPFKEEDIIVSTVTGHGLKDPNRAIEIAPNPELIENSEDAVINIIKNLI